MIYCRINTQQEDQKIKKITGVIVNLIQKFGV